MADPRILTVDENNNQKLQSLFGEALPALSATANTAAVTAVLQFNQPDGAGTLTKTALFDGTIIGAYAIKTGAAGGAADAATVKIGSNTSVVIDLNGANDKEIVTGSKVTIDDTVQAFSTDDTISCVAGNGAGNNAAQVYVIVAKA